MQIPGGMLADRFGAKRVLIAALLIWSVFTGLTGLATSPRALFYWFVVPGVLGAAVVWRFFPGGTVPGVEAPGAMQRGRGPSVSGGPPWSAFVAYPFFNVACWGLIGWMPTHFNQTRHIELRSLGAAASIPYLAGFVGLVVMGALGHRVFDRQRALLTGAGYLLAGGGLFAAYQA